MNIMQSEKEVQDRINVLVAEMKAMREQQPSNLFAYMEAVRLSERKCKEIRVLYSVIEKPFPESIKSLLIQNRY